MDFNVCRMNVQPSCWTVVFNNVAFLNLRKLSAQLKVSVDKMLFFHVVVLKLGHS